MESSENLHERDIQIKMLRLYKSQSLLWDTSNRLYRNKVARNHAYQNILKLYQRIKPTAKLADVKKKMENLRTCYKKELKKVKASLESSDGSEEPHKPALWYYDLMKFLDKDGAPQEIETSNAEVTFLNNEVTEEIFQENSYDETTTLLEFPAITLPFKQETEMCISSTVNSSHSSTPSNSGKIVNHKSTNSQPRSVNQCETFGVYVGQQLELLKAQQQAIAQKLISDALFFAKLDLLTPTASVLSAAPTVQLVSSSFVSTPSSNNLKPKE